MKIDTLFDRLQEEEQKEKKKTPIPGVVSIDSMFEEPGRYPAAPARRPVPAQPASDEASWLQAAADPLGAAARGAQYFGQAAKGAAIRSTSALAGQLAEARSAAVNLGQDVMFWAILKQHAPEKYEQLVQDPKAMEKAFEVAEKELPVFLKPLAAAVAGQTAAQREQHRYFQETLAEKTAEAAPYSPGAQEAAEEGRFWDLAYAFEHGLDVAGDLAQVVAANVATGGAAGLPAIATKAFGETRKQARERLEQKGAPSPEAGLKGTISGAAVASVAAVTEHPIIQKLFPSQWLGGSGASRALAKAVKKNVREAGKAAAAEAGQEFLEGLAEDTAQFLVEQDPEAYKGFVNRSLERAMFGAIGGGVARATIGTAGAVGEKAREKWGKVSDKIAEQAAEIAQSPEGVRKLQALGEKESPSRSDIEEAGFRVKDEKLNRTERQAISEAIRNPALAAEEAVEPAPAEPAAPPSVTVSEDLGPLEVMSAQELDSTIDALGGLPEDVEFITIGDRIYSADSVANLLTDKMSQDLMEMSNEFSQEEDAFSPPKKTPSYKSFRDDPTGATAEMELMPAEDALKLYGVQGSVYMLNRLLAKARGQGGGTRVLNMAKEHAEKVGIPIMLEVSAYSGMPEEQAGLIQYYKNQGFEPATEQFGDELLIYHPRATEAIEDIGAMAEERPAKTQEAAEPPTPAAATEEAPALPAAEAQPTAETVEGKKIVSREKAAAREYKKGNLEAAARIEEDAKFAQAIEDDRPDVLKKEDEIVERLRAEFAAEEAKKKQRRTEAKKRPKLKPPPAPVGDMVPEHLDPGFFREHQRAQLPAVSEEHGYVNIGAITDKTINIASGFIVEDGGRKRGEAREKSTRESWISRNVFRWMRARGRKPIEIFRSYEKARAVTKAEALKAKYLQFRVEGAAKAAYHVKGYGDVPEQVQRDVDAALKGEKPALELPPSLQEPVAALRSHIDSLSGRLTGMLKDQMGVARDATLQSERESLINEWRRIDWQKELNKSAKRLGHPIPRRIREAAEPPADFEPLITPARQAELDALQGKWGLIETIENNMGKYLNRSFQAFDDPLWEKHVSEEARDRAREWFAQEYPYASKSYIDQTINEILHEAVKAGGLPAFLKASKVGKKDLTIFKERKEIPREIRQLLGEYKDLSNYARTALKMSNLLANHEFLVDVRNAGIDKFLFEIPDLRILKRKWDKAQGWIEYHSDKQEEFERGMEGSENKAEKGIFRRKAKRAASRVEHWKRVQRQAHRAMRQEVPEEAYVTISSENNPSYAPLDGLKTFPEIAQELERMNKYASPEGIWRLFNDASRWARKSVTVRSARGLIRNFVSNPMMLMANGYFPTTPSEVIEYSKYAHESWRVTRANISHILRGASSEDVTEDDVSKLLRATELGVMGDSTTAGWVRGIGTTGPSAVKAFIAHETDRPGLRPIKKLAVGTDEFMEELWAAGDDYWKYIQWRAQTDRFFKRGMDREVAEEKSAEIIKNISPTYSRLFEALKALQRTGLPMAPFTAFQTEQVRNLGNRFSQAHKEMYSTNPLERDRAMAIRRLAGQSMAFMLGEKFLGGLSRMLFGISKEDDEDLREFVHEWSRDTPWFYGSSVREDGTFRFRDLGYQFPQTSLTEAWRAFNRGENWQEGLINSTKSFLGEYVKEDLFAERVIDALRGETAEGFPLYNEEDDFGEKAKAVLMHLASAVVPATANQARDIYRGAVKFETPGGRVYDFKDEYLSVMTGGKTITYDLPKRMAGIASRHQKAIQNSNYIFRQHANKRGRVPPSTFASAYDRMERNRQRNFEMVVKKSAAMIRLVGRDMWRAAMEEAEVPDKYIDQIESGEYKPYIPSDLSTIQALIPYASPEHRQLLEQEQREAYKNLAYRAGAEDLSEAREARATLKRLGVRRDQQLNLLREELLDRTRSQFISNAKRRLSPKQKQDKKLIQLIEDRAEALVTEPAMTESKRRRFVRLGTSISRLEELYSQ